MASNRLKITAGAKALFDLGMRGVKNEMALVMEEAKADVDFTREELGALTLRRHVCKDAMGWIRDEIAAGQHAELVAELQATREALKQARNSGTGFSSDQVQLPMRSSDKPPIQ